MDKIFLVISTLCFFGGFAYAVNGLRAGRHHDSRANLLVMGLGFAFLCATLYLRGQIHQRCPITSLHEVLIFLSWSMGLLYFILGKSFRLSLLGVFTAPLVLLFQLVALVGFFMEGTPAAIAKKTDQIDVWLELHASVSLVSFGALALAGVAGLMYLVQNRQLKRHQLKTLFYNLPPIQYLITAMFRLIAIGVMLLTIGTASAFFMRNVPAPIHQGLSMLTLLLYIILLVLYRRNRIGNIKLAQGAILLFSLPLLILMIL
ncbi:MAG: cytochrome c biogenesis protein [Verrucomicrobiales bacterium]|nr:cytochrome c biogenesis protein [Verrucomicrobiales bacterium]